MISQRTMTVSRSLLTALLTIATRSCICRLASEWPSALPSVTLPSLIITALRCSIIITTCPSQHLTSSALVILLCSRCLPAVVLFVVFAVVRCCSCFVLFLVVIVWFLNCIHWMCHIPYHFPSDRYARQRFARIVGAPHNEDEKCSAGVFGDKVDDHLFYFNMHLGDYCSSVHHDDDLQPSLRLVDRDSISDVLVSPLQLQEPEQEAAALYAVLPANSQ